ncbi:MAG: peptide-N-glycosidase F-related protein [Phycisphaerales bacterium]
MKHVVLILALVLAGCVFPAVALAEAIDDETVVIFNRAGIDWHADGPGWQAHDGYVSRERGQVIEARINLPQLPIDQRDARRIVLELTLEPVIITDGEVQRFSDPWPRLCHVTVVPNGAVDAGLIDDDEPGDDAGPKDSGVELMRVVSGFGGSSTFTQDVTALALLLDGETTIRVRLSTWTSPGWNVTLKAHFTQGEAGYRRPKLVQPIFRNLSLTAENNRAEAIVDIPPGLSLPRLRLLTTGHGGSQEFMSATHVIRIDGREVMRLRPWREDGGSRHAENPSSRRLNIDGRELWSSDIDRAGWMPGSVVKPITVPLPELTPGRHTIELQLLDVVPPTRGPEGNATSAGGYWMISGQIVADEPWPR